MAGIYIHIPFCKQACYYCNFHFSTKKNYKILIKSIEKEVFLKKTFLKNEKIESIYFGGGTPSLIKSSSIKKIIDAINENYIIKPECEITLEANPDDITEEILRQWKMIGINRISIGIQSFNDTILKIIDRKSTQPTLKLQVSAKMFQTNISFSHGDFHADRFFCKRVYPLCKYFFYEIPPV